MTAMLHSYYFTVLTANADSLTEKSHHHMHRTPQRILPTSSSFCGCLLLSFSCILLPLDTASAIENVAPNSTTSISGETLVIDDKRYTIPGPWAGNKISAPSLPMNAFRQIPTENTKEGSHIYVLEATHSALLQLFTAAKKDGIVLRIESGFRSTNYQKKIFSRMLAEGRDFDDIIRYVAPPGYSQHALGTAVDFSPSNWRFASLPDYQWLKDNGEKFGFTETYPQHNRLHYPWEAWHWCYSKKGNQIDMTPHRISAIQTSKKP